MGLVAQWCHGLARTRWAHCCDCGEKLDYQIGSIAWGCIERGYKGKHRCPSCQGEHDAGLALESFRKALRAKPAERSER